MPDASPRLNLPYIAASQAQKHVTHNEALRLLDGLAQLALKSFDATTPPATPAEGDMYALGAAPTGAWAGAAGKLALWSDAAWIFITPQEGWLAWGAAESEQRVFTGGNWQEVIPTLQNLESVGVNTTADLTNRLSVAADASLFSHDGSGHQMKVNKATTGDTASLLYQTAWTGHAEIGLAGDNDFHVKVSPDGTSWTSALIIDQSSGHMTGEAVQASATDTTPGRLARADYAYSPGNLLGTVAQSGGIPTGAVIERGANANGEYIRWADGTQICTHTITVPDVSMADGAGYRSSSSANWVFPASFASGTIPALTGSFNEGLGVWAACYCSNNSACSFRAQCFSPITSSRTVYVTANGRWY